MEKDRITELEAENSRLKAELEKAKEREADYEEARRATLFMLEDVERSRDEIGRAKREWEETFDSISDPLFIHDREFKVVRANMAYAKAAGMDFKEFIGRPYYEVFPKMEGPFRMCLKALELQEEEEEEFFYPLTNRIFKVRFYPIKDVNGRYLYSIHILEDITEAKRSAERIKEEMDVTSHLLMISEATASTTDIEKLMEEVVHCGHEIVKCDICLSYLWDSETKVFRPSQAIGLSHELIPMFKTESLDMKVGFVKEAMKKKEPVIIQLGVKSPQPPFNKEGNFKSPPLAKGDLGGFSWLPDIHTIAVIPLISKKEPLGLIVGVYLKTTPHLHPLPMRGEEIKGGHPLPEGEGRGEGKFSDRDMKVMRGIMHQVSTALEQARLYKESMDKTMELSHKIETIQTMHEIDRSILSTLESEEILETVTRMVARVIPCERATVVLVDRERGGFLYVAGFGVTFAPKGTFVPFKDSSAEEMVKTGRTEYVSNLAEMKGLLPIEERFLKDGFLSHIRLPLIVKGEIAAVLTVGAKRPSAFTPEDLSTLEKMAYQIGVALSNARLLSDLEELFLGTVKSLSSAIDAKSPWTSGHSERVTKYALDIAREMGLAKEDIKALEVAGLLHDIGKIGTYDILLDKPGKLEPDEVEIVRRHPGKGAEILDPIRRFKDIIPAIKHHHEFYDGTGYPDRLKGEEIPLLARVLAVADTFDAMKADRPYRPGRTMEFILEEFKRCSGTQFDPKVVGAFFNVIGEREELKMAAS
jgi:putative nucleotidyltransferase with HDIG domain/PAS domain S-box-containing protein